MHRPMRLLLPLLLLACEPPVAVPPLPAPVATPAMGVRLAGEGAFTPLVVRLTREFSDRNPGEALVVEAAVGGRGAQRALADGVLDAAIVARSVGQPLAAGGVRVAGTEVVLAAGRGTGLRGRLSPERLAGLLSAEVPGKLRLFLRGPEDALEQALVASAPLLGPSFEGALQTQRWPVLTDESALRETLRGVPGAVVLADTGFLALHGLPVWTVPVVEPPPRVELVVVARADAPPRLTQFLAWVAGPEGQALVQELGYRPITGAP
jgi:hypothetical protein